VRIRSRRAIYLVMSTDKRPVADIESEGIELRPDGWERFERAVVAAAKGGRKPAAKASSSHGGSRPARPEKPRETSSA
jgi:hypothetical protein